MTESANFIHYSTCFDGVRNTPYQEVPIKPATDETLREFGWLVHDFDQTDVIRVTWPKLFGRPIRAGTGNRQKLEESEFVIRWKDDVLYADDIAFDADLAHNFSVGRQEDDKREYIFAREANYHPDGSQVFFPKERKPFVMYLAPPCGDAIKLEYFTTFAFDGSCGVHILPNVWHNSPYTSSESLTFRNKESSVMASVHVDFVNEFGKYLKVPLKL